MHVPHRVIYVVMALALLGSISLIGFVSSYARMVWKVTNYNALRQEMSTLRVSYARLQKSNNQTKDQLAELQLFASEVSMVYGIKEKLEGPSDIADEGTLMPTVKESLEEYNFLRTANLTSRYHRGPRSWLFNTRPGIWPIDGRLESPFGKRSDPFSGEGAYHWGVDIAGTMGEPVHAAADGVVLRTDFVNGFGRLVVIDHGNGFQTYYAHLSRFAVVPGQEIRQGEVLGAVGASGRVTAPHLHYEVHQNGSPVNPQHYLTQTAASLTNVRKDFPF